MKSRTHLAASTILPIALSAIFGSHALGQGFAFDSTGPNSNRPRSDTRLHSSLRLESYRIRGSCDEQGAKIEVTERFRNLGSNQAEAVFLFPIPSGTTARGIALIVNGKRMAGEVLEAGQAGSIYREIVRRARDPALLEYVDDGLLRASVFPIPPNGCVDVEIQLEVAARSVGAGLRSLTLPWKQTAGTQAEVDLELSIAPSDASAHLTTLYSPTHSIAIDRKPTGPAFVRHRGTVEDSRDLTLYFGTDREADTIAVLTDRAAGQDVTFELIYEALASARSAENALPPTPRDIVFVLDRSGSMEGEKWHQAVRSLKFGIDSLREADRFALISFATDVRTFASSLVTASAEQRNAAKQHLDALAPGGGTSIGGALDAALAQVKRETERLPIIVFLTDGLPTVGEIDPKRLVENSRDKNVAKSRIFTFGVGHDVNTHLLDRIAEESRGDSDYVAPQQDLEIPLSGFFAKISEPALVAPVLEVAGASIYDVYPPQLPDVFQGGLIRVVGRVRGDGPHEFVLRGQRGGSEVRFTRMVDLSNPARAVDLPARHASRKIGYLLDQVRLNGASKELVEQVTALGREFGIVTPYTSGLVVEDDLSTAGLRDRIGGGGPGGGSVPSTPGSSGQPSGPTTGGGLGKKWSTAGPSTGARGSASDGRAAPTSGASAVAEAEHLKKLKSGALEDAGERKAAPSTRKIGTRTFDRPEKTWIDSALTEELKKDMTKLEAFSDEYFALLLKHPELKDVFALGDDLIVVIDGKAWHIVPPTGA